MKNLVHQSLDMKRYEKYTIDLNEKSGETQTNVFDMRRSLQVKPKLQAAKEKRTQHELLSSIQQRMKVRDLAASKRLKATIGSDSFNRSAAGKSSENYGAPFTYLRGCLPSNRKLDSNRSNGSTKSRDFMISLSSKASKTPIRCSYERKELVTNPYSLYQTEKAI